MPTDDPKGRSSGFEGFHSYADDDMPRDREFREPIRPSVEVRREDEAPTFIPTEPPARARRSSGKAMVLGGLLVAVIAGVFLARDLPPLEKAPPRAAPVETATPSPPVNVEVAALAPAPIAPPSEATRLEVLPADSRPATFAPPRPRTGLTPTYEADRGAPPPLIELPQRQSPRPVAVAPPQPTPEAPRAMVAAPPAARDAVAVTSDPPPPSMTCRDAPTLARAMVCADRGLSEADRKMKRAYAAALAAGAPEEDLRLDQDDWLDIREQAAQHSRRAVMSIYRQRIAELEDMARR